MAEPLPPSPAARSAAPGDVPSRDAADRAAASALPVLGICHAGVALRSLLVVHGLAALVLGLGEPSWAAWLQGLGLVVLVLLPATLTWLALVCALLPRLAGQRPAWRLALTTVLGGLMALGAWLGLRAVQAALMGAGVLSAPVADGWQGPAALAAVLAGAGLAAVLHQWLELRAGQAAPAADAARLAELQSRIRPHFLFNTLNSAITLVQVDPQRAEAVLEDLAELFRAALGQAGLLSDLAAELELARRYLEIEAVRFGERLRVHWQLDPAAGAAPLPALVLQPLVENAVRHGVEARQRGGDIIVRTRRVGQQAEVVIANALPEQPRPGQGMALRNVEERLRLMHDLALGFEAGVVQPGSRGRQAAPVAPESRLGEQPAYWRVRLLLPLAGAAGTAGAAGARAPRSPRD